MWNFGFYSGLHDYDCSFFYFVNLITSHDYRWLTIKTQKTIRVLVVGCFSSLVFTHCNLSELLFYVFDLNRVWYFVIFFFSPDQTSVFLLFFFLKREGLDLYPLFVCIYLYLNLLFIVKIVQIDIISEDLLLLLSV